MVTQAGRVTSFFQGSQAGSPTDHKLLGSKRPESHQPAHPGPGSSLICPSRSQHRTQGRLLPWDRLGGTELFFTCNQDTLPYNFHPLGKEKMSLIPLFHDHPFKYVKTIIFLPIFSSPCQTPAVPWLLLVQISLRAFSCWRRTLA